MKEESSAQTQPRRRRKRYWLIVASAMCLAVVPVVDLFFFRGDTSNPQEQLERMSPAERQYCESVLSQITADSSEADVVALLGKPSRDLKWKKNWWVSHEGHRARVGVFFSFNGRADKIVLDGDRYYYEVKAPRRTELNDSERTDPLHE